jgi:hypothetical protein
VPVDTVYGPEEREADECIIKQLFGKDRNAMQELITEPNGKRYLEEFVLRPDSIV